MKIKLILGCFLVALIGGLLFVVSYQSHKIDTLKTAKNVLEANNQVLQNRLVREHNDAMELGRKNKELEDSAKRDIGFDWNFIIADTDVVRWLHENAIRVQGDRARAD